MWKKYKISIDKFINNSKDDFFQINIIPFYISKNYIENVDLSDKTSLNNMFKIYFNNVVNNFSENYLMVIEPEQKLYTIYDLMVLINFLHEYKIYNYNIGRKIKINYALFWKNEVFIETGCLVINYEYPTIYNFYTSSVVEDILDHLYDFKIDEYRTQ